MSQRTVKRHVGFILIVLLSINAHAQEKGTVKPINTDRPGQSINPYTAGNRALQFQSGYGFLRDNLAVGDINFHNFDVNTKFGISDRFEFSFLLQLSSLLFDPKTMSSSGSDVEPDNGLSQYSISSRGLIMKGEGLKPAIGLEATYLTAGTPGDDLDNRLGRFILTLQNQLSPKFSFTGNVVYFTNNRTEFTANLGYSINDQIGVFAEYWPIFEATFDGESGLFLQDSFMNTGVFWQLGDDFMIDLAGGFRVFAPEFMDGTESYYLQVGLTKRFWL